MAIEVERRPLATPPSQSLIGWGAVFAGAFAAFVVMILLGLLGVAVGLTGDNSVGTGAAIWSIIAAVAALFFGGWVMSRSELMGSRGDAALHGIVLWGVLFFGVMIVLATGLQTGLNIVTSALVPMVGQLDVARLAQIATEIGIPDPQLQELQQRLGEMGGVATRSAWWGLAGMLLTLGAVVWGAAAGVPGEKASGRRVHRQAEGTA